MGAFTTFSSFILETFELLNSAEWLYGLANFGFQTIFGFSALAFGIIVGRIL